MRLHILSDLHLEFAPYAWADTGADVVIFAGDVHTGANGLKWILQTIHDRPVIYVLGNHEFYGQALPKLTNELKELAAGTNVHVLENDSVRIANVMFAGATLWTDFRLDGDVVLSATTAQIGMSDFKRIRTSPRFSRIRPADMRSLHNESRTWLEAQFTAHAGEKLVVVTHHAPSPKSVPERFRGDPLNPAFASNLDDLIGPCGACLWIHGHIHTAVDYKVGTTRVLANPRGYPGEQTGFVPDFVVEI